MGKTIDFSGRPFHFIGIGGIGMSALAHILAKRELPVSGSDLRSTHIIERLQKVGVHIFNHQEATNLELFSCNQKQALKEIPASNHENKTFQNESLVVSEDELSLEQKYLPQVICSTAITNDNSEYLAAKKKGCPVFHRSDILAALISDYKSIGVAGTHGKTTTSSLIGYMLLEAGIDPTIIIGGEVDAWDGNARIGAEKGYLVAEVDESDGSLIKHHPHIGVITNIELDHPDHYQNLDDVINTFQIFAAQCDILVGSLDCEIISSYLSPHITYSLDFNKQADYTVKNLVNDNKGARAEVWERGIYLGKINLTVLGNHNVSNTLAAIAVGRKIGLEFSVIVDSLLNFQSPKRRFEKRGYCNEITFIDDYAHHPSEIKATLSAARSKIDNKLANRIVVIFQPHRYSRTFALLEKFATCFNEADLVVLTDIYSAGEINTNNIYGEDLAKEVSKNHPKVLYFPSLEDLPQKLPELLQPKDLVLFLGAGNLNHIIPHIIDLCRTSK